MSSRKPCIVLLAKRFARAKSRLSEVLADDDRQRLARTMFECSFAAVRLAADVSSSIVVATDCDEIAALATHGGASVFRDRDVGPLGRVVDRALGEIARQGESSALVLVSDLPRLTGESVIDCANALRESDCVIAPDRHRLGTNAFGLLLPAEPTCFGRSDSFDAHVRQAQSAGLRVAIFDRPEFALDIDSPDDLAIYEKISSKVRPLGLGLRRGAADFRRGLC